MSLGDTMMPSVSAPWGDLLGGMDFTGQCFPAEPLAVFQPCITLSIDDLGRRWIAETGGDGAATGPVWCIFPQPRVAVYVSDDVVGFVTTLRDRARSETTLAWLQGLTAQAHAVWAKRRTLGVCRRDCDEDPRDERVQRWMSLLPRDARVYDLRQPSTPRGLPYGVAAAEGRLYRCERLPLFAVTGWPTGRFWAHIPAEIFPDPPVSGAAGATMPLMPPAFRLYRPRGRRERRRPAATAGWLSCA